MLFLGLLTFAAAAINTLGRRFSFRAPQLYLGFGFIASIALSLIAQRWFGGAVQAVVGLQSSVGVLFIVACGMQSFKSLKALAITLVLVALWLTGEGVLAYHFGYNADQLIITDAVLNDNGLAQTMLRVRSRAGILNDPNDFAQHLLTMLPFLWLGWRKGNLPRNLIVVLAPAAFLLYGVYLTHSRGALVSLGILILIVVGKRVGPAARVGLICLTLMCLPLLSHIAGRSLSGQDGSTRGRVEAWSEGLHMLRSSPIFGAGFGFYTEHAERTAHNSFVLCFGELGLVGYFFWTGLLLISALQLRALMKLPLKDPVDFELHRWANVLEVAFYGYIGAALFLSRTYIVTLYVLLGMIVVLTEIARREKKPVFELRLGSFCTRVLAFDFASMVVVYLFIRVGYR